MKKILPFVLCIIAIAAISLFVSCKKNDENVYTVSFDLNGGICTDLESFECVDGTVVDLTKYVPSREYYIFNGWSLDGVIVTNSTIKDDVTFTAEWEYVFELEERTGDSTYAIKGIKADYTKAELVLPEEYENKKIVELKSGALARAAGVKSLVVGNGYTEIEAGTFAPLTKVEKISVPFFGTETNENYYLTLFDTSTDADDLHFIITDNEIGYLMPLTLKTLEVTGGTIVPDVKKLKLENFVLSSLAITEIEARTFYKDDTLKSIDLSGCKNIVKIGDSNFSECKNLLSVNLSGLEKLTVMGTHSFYFYVPGSEDKHAFDKIDLSGLKSLETFGQMSFWYISVDELDFSETSVSAFGRQSIFHSSVKKIGLPATFNPVMTEEESGILEEKYDLTYLNNSEFLSKCEGITEIAVDKLSLYATVENGVLYDFDKKVALKYASGNDSETYVAPTTLLKIAPTAFENATSLKEIDLSTCMVNSIGYNAFDGCTANITVGFDQYSYYKKDGSTVSLGSGWNGDCKINYGERYLFFAFSEKNISENLTVAKAEFSFDITATYGDDKALVTVMFDGESVNKNENGYTIILKSGENVITAVASFDGLTSETKKYTVTLDEEWTIVTDFKDGHKIVWANGNLTFKVSAFNAKDEKQQLKDVSIKVDCGYSSTFVKPFSGVEIVYNDDGSATVTLDSDTLLMNDFNITKLHHICIEIKQSSNISVSKTYEAQYFEQSPEIYSETPVNGNIVNDEWVIDVEAKIGNTALKITDVKIEMATDGAFFGNTTYLSSDILADGMKAEIKIDIAGLSLLGYIYDGDSFKIRITLTTEAGFTITQIFNAEYSE